MFSYFESVGDQQYSLENALLDEIWNRIRVNPDELPIGSIRIIPGTMYQRLSHQPLKVHDAKASLQEESVSTTYTLDYPALQRTLSIYFETDFPHKITSWEETYPDGFGENVQMLTTTATLSKNTMNDYWNKNSPLIRFTGKR